ncbi:MAG: hypothetical protein IBJ11_09455 [Phycisphaerales bacterium]|nr:hypothetical protein [Phycisphaerales bacterium]
MPGIEPDRVLCESCGYDLRGLSASAACPECGRSVSSSLPTARRGSPWQRRPGLAGWLRTAAAVLGDRRTLWPGVEVELDRSALLFATNIGVASAIPVVSLLLAGGHADFAPFFFLGLAAVFTGLTWTEMTGLRFFGARRGWRTTAEVAGSVCAHASVGWILSGVAVALAWQVHARTDWLVRLAQSGVFGYRVGVLVSLPAMLAAAFLSGLLLFEMLVYSGFRAMRFANRPAPGRDWSGRAVIA